MKVPQLNQKLGLADENTEFLAEFQGNNYRCQSIAAT